VVTVELSAFVANVVYTSETVEVIPLISDSVLDTLSRIPYTVDSS